MVIVFVPRLEVQAAMVVGDLIHAERVLVVLCRFSEVSHPNVDVTESEYTHERFSFCVPAVLGVFA
jgi:hypothetical protein